MSIKHSTTNWSVSVPKPLAEKVGVFLKHQRRSKSEFVSEAIRQYLIQWWDMGLDSEKPKKISKDQKWIWTKEIQSALSESVKDLKQGRFKISNNPDEFFSDLKK